MPQCCPNWPEGALIAIDNIGRFWPLTAGSGTWFPPSGRVFHLLLSQ